MTQKTTIAEIIAQMPKKVKRVWIEDPDFILKALKDPSFEGAIVGTYSVYNLRQRCCYVWRNPESFEIPISPTAVSRKIIEKILADSGRKAYPKELRDFSIPLKSAPLYAVPYEGDLIYLDLKSAFFQIYSKLPVFLNYNQVGYHFAPTWIYPSLPSDLRAFKLVRNSIVGNWRSKSVCRIKNQNLSVTEQNIGTSNFAAWNFIMAALHCFAAIALEAGAVYVHTDGYIFDAKSDWHHFRDYLESLGFFLATKARGHGRVYGLGRYEIGVYTTKIVGEMPQIDKVDRSREPVLILTQIKKYNPYWKASCNDLSVECQRQTLGSSPFI